MKRSILFGSSILLAGIFIAAGAFINKKNDIPANHLEVVLRGIGHQLLLSAKDSTSRVLPVKKLNATTWQVSFQNNVSFISDTLINIVERELAKNDLAKDYIVRLRNCKQNETVFAFEINNSTGNLTPCRGRTLKSDCYFIEIDLLKTKGFNYALLLLLIIPLGIAGFYGYNSYRKKEVPKMQEANEPATGSNDHIPFGSFQLYTEQHLLKTAHETIPLSEKETKALKIFAEHINQVVDRDILMKAIWEDEGVVVISRNVDVLVSKLRKKLSGDSSIKFINVHGRGYKCVME